MSQDISKLDEKYLVKQAIKGDKKALEALITKYINFCYSIAIILIEDDKLSKKVVEETLTQVYISIEQLYNPKGFKVWLYEILKKTIEKIRPKGKVIEQASMDFADKENAKINYLTVEKISETELANAERLFNILRKLPEIQKEIVVLVDFEGLSCLQVSQMLDMEVNQVRQELYIAKNKLKEIYSPIPAKNTKEKFFSPVPPLIKPNEDHNLEKNVLEELNREPKIEEILTNINIKQNSVEPKIVFHDYEDDNSL